MFDVVEVSTFETANYVRLDDLLSMLELPNEDRSRLIQALKKMQLSDAHNGASVH